MTKPARLFLKPLLLLLSFNGLLLSTAFPMGNEYKGPDLFGIYTATLDGRDMKLLIVWSPSYKSWTTFFHTMKPDGSERVRVPLPDISSGYYLKGPAFFPGSGSGKDAKIIFSGKKLPTTLSPRSTVGTILEYS